MTNFEKLKRMSPEDFARFIMDGKEHNDFFIFTGNGIDGDWYDIHDFIKWLKSEAAEENKPTGGGKTVLNKNT